MSDKNRNSCQFAEQIIAYLYGENAPNEKTQFEAHLPNCQSCHTEISGLQTVRSSILEWRAAEFENSDQPLIDVSTITGVVPKSEANESAGNFGGWRRFFSFNPVFAAAMAAITVACLGIVFFAVNFSGNQDVARSGEEKNQVKPTAAPTVEISNKATEKIAETSKPTEKIAAPSSRETVNAEERERKITPVKTAVKNSAAPKAEPINRRAGDETNKKSAPVKKPSVPNLNDLEDEADDSIRLADLFAELDTK